jgi:hypothetical protein
MSSRPADGGGREATEARTAISPARDGEEDANSQQRLPPPPPPHPGRHLALTRPHLGVHLFTVPIPPSLCSVSRAGEEKGERTSTMFRSNLCIFESDLTTQVTPVAVPTALARDSGMNNTSAVRQSIGGATRPPAAKRSIESSGILFSPVGSEKSNSGATVCAREQR